MPQESGATPTASPARRLPGIRAYLLLLLAVAFVPLLAIGGLLVWRQSALQNEELERTLDGSVVALSLAVDRELQSYVRMLQTLSESPSLTADLDEFRALSERVAAHNGVLFVSMFDAGRRQVMNTAVPPGQPLPQPISMEKPADETPLSPDVTSIARVFETQRPAYSRLFRSLSLKRIIFTINIPVLREGSVRYMLNVGLDAEVIAALLRRDSTFIANPAEVLDPNGLIVARSSDGVEHTGEPSSLLTGVILEDAGDVLHGDSSDGSRRVAVARSAVTRWQSVMAVEHATLAQRRQNVFIAAALLALAALAGLLAAGTLARSIRKSVERLERTAEDDADRPGAGQRIREFASVESSLRALAETQRKEAEERERRLAAEVERQQAEIENRRKDMYLATLAHELRNPLSPIRNAVSLLKRPDAGEHVLAWARDVIDRQVTQMAHLLDDLLEVARIAQGKIRLRRSVLDLRDVVASAVEAAAPAARLAMQRIDVDLPAEPAWVEGDQTRLLQILGNLLANAAKYGERDGVIAVTARREAAEVVVSVKDSGIGIPAEMLDTIFEPFAQVPQSDDRAQGGLGIGLALVRGLVELHGGSVSARSEGLGRGAEFTVRLPTCAARPVSHPPASADAIRLGGVRVLVVDDNVDSADTLAAVLRAAGGEVDVAYTGSAALEAIARTKPDCAIVDIGLPDISGYELARQMLEAADRPRLVALSGWGQDADRSKALAAGFELHLVKPVDPERVLEALHDMQLGLSSVREYVPAADGAGS